MIFQKYLLTSDNPKKQIIFGGILMLIDSIFCGIILYLALTNNELIFPMANGGLGWNEGSYLYIGVHGGVFLLFLVDLILNFHIVSLGFSSRGDGKYTYIEVSPTERTNLMKKLNAIDISQIDYIRFIENSGVKFDLHLDSIKQIAVYIYKKTGKKTFSPGELHKEKEMLIQNYESFFPKNIYDSIVGTMSDWTREGGSFEIVKKKRKRD